jgi:hypothetical protein
MVDPEAKLSRAIKAAEVHVEPIACIARTGGVAWEVATALAPLRGPRSCASPWTAVEN